MKRYLKFKLKSLILYATVISLSVIVLSFVSQVGHARLVATIQPPSYEQKNPYSKTNKTNQINSSNYLDYIKAE